MTARFEFEGIGTPWTIVADEPLPVNLRLLIRDRIERFDAIYSRFRPDSLVSLVAASEAGGRFPFPDDAPALFALYDRLHDLTDGAVDPLVGRDLERLGYDAAYTLTPASQTSGSALRGERPTWRGSVNRTGAVLETRAPLLIDIGAAGKGYLVDLVAALVRDAGIAEFVVDAGGDLRHVGETAVRVGLEHPADARRLIGVANLKDGALCASATNRRTWGPGLHHLLDGRTGAPASEVLATWVIADVAAVADGLATALFLAEPAPLADAFRFDYVRIHTSGRIEVSQGFDGQLFT